MGCNALILSDCNGIVVLRCDSIRIYLQPADLRLQNIENRGQPLTIGVGAYLKVFVRKLKVTACGIYP